MQKLTFILILIFGLIFSGMGIQEDSASANNSDPCYGITWLPGGPGNSPDPQVGGQVIDSTDNSGIASIDIDLYRCDGGASILHASTTTDSSGFYNFASSSLLSEYYYYVDFDTSGDLSGRTSTSGYADPSPLVAVPDGSTTVDYSVD